MAQQAQIASHIESLPNGYLTPVGERGVRLSGGQRQRIGIARALYKKAEVLVLDEATSALDNETETAVMECIAGLSKDLTVLIIAHRISTLRQCDFVVRMEGVQSKVLGVLMNYQPFHNLPIKTSKHASELTDGMRLIN